MSYAKECIMNTEKINRRMQELTDSGEMAAGTLMISQNAFSRENGDI